MKAGDLFQISQGSLVEELVGWWNLACSVEGRNLWLAALRVLVLARGKLREQVDSERDLHVQKTGHQHHSKEPALGTHFCYDSLHQLQHKVALEESPCQQAQILLRLLLSRVVLLGYYGQHGKKNLWWLHVEPAVPMGAADLRRLPLLLRVVEACAMVLAKEAWALTLVGFLT